MSKSKQFIPNKHQQANNNKQVVSRKQQQTQAAQPRTHHTTTTFENFETTKNETRGTPGVLKL